jgi:hypothetical protein
MACDATQLVICADLFIFSIPFGIFCAFPNRSNKLGSASIKCIYSPGRDPKWYLHSSATFKCGDEIGQHEADGIAKRIGGGMNLGAQAAFWPSQRVSFKPVFGLIAFFWGTGTVLVGTHECAVNEDVFKVGVLALHLEKTLPNAATTPAVEALVNGVPCFQTRGALSNLTQHASR